MKQASFLDTLKTVLAAFIGVRRKAVHEEIKINPVHVIIVAVTLVVVFIFTLSRSFASSPAREAMKNGA